MFIYAMNFYFTIY